MRLVCVSDTHNDLDSVKIPDGDVLIHAGDLTMRVLTQTEQDQCQRQQAQLARGGCYIFAERVSEAIDELVRYRDEVLARMT